MCKFAPEIINTGKNTMNEIPICPDCSHEFDSVEDAAEVDDVARDSNGAKVKGSSMVIKRGTKVSSIVLKTCFLKK